MKKIGLFLLVFLCWQPVFAQSKVIYANERNFRTELGALFHRSERAIWGMRQLAEDRNTPQQRAAFIRRGQQLAGQNPDSAWADDRETLAKIDKVMQEIEAKQRQQEFRGRRKQWQVAFLTMDSLAKTALYRLQNKVEEGIIARGAFLVWEEKDEIDETGLSLWEILEKTESQQLHGTLYMVYPSSKGAVTEELHFSCKPEISDVSELLLKNLSAHNDAFYTALVMFAHGDRENMYDGKMIFSYDIEDFFDTIEKLDFHIDVLDMVSCYMGSLRTVYLMAKGNLVDYSIFSSDYAVSGASKRVSHFLRFLGSNVENSIKDSVSSNPQFLLAVMQANELGYNIKDLRKPLLQWSEKYVAMVKHGPKGMAGQLYQSWPRRDHYLFDDFIKQQMDYVRTHLDIQDPVNKEFMQSSGRLLRMLQKNKIAQWCLKESKCTRRISFRPGDMLYIWSEYGLYIDS